MAMVVTWRGSTGLNEAPDSPEWDFDDKVSCVRKFTGPHALCLSTAALRGAIGTGAQAGMLVSKSNVTRQRGTTGLLVITWEGPASGILPPDEAETEIEKVERVIRAHPRYANFAGPHTNQEYLENIKLALESTSKETVTTAEGVIATSPLAQELYTKMQRGNTHYPFYAPVFKYTTHSWSAPGGLTVGGFRQTPPNLPLIPPATDWLREGDRVSWNGTMWTTERRWIGGPDLDTDLFP